MSATLMWLGIGIGLAGCSTLLPAHPNSEDVDGEALELQLLTPKELADGALQVDPNVRWDQSQWEATRLEIPKPKPNELATTDIGGAAAAALGVIASAVSASLQAEQEKYTAQFEADAESDSFWEDRPDRLVQRLAGFRLVRWTDDMPKSAGVPAFDLVCEFRGVKAETSSTVGRLRIAPVAMITRRSKAKVLHNNWGAKPYAALWTWMFATTDAVNQTIQVSIEGTWDGKAFTKDAEEAKGSAPNSNVSLGVVEIRQNGYLISEPKALAPATPTKRIAIPLSYKQLTDHSLAIGLKVVVTEQDSSNATKYLKFLSEKVDKFKAQ